MHDGYKEIEYSGVVATIPGKTKTTASARVYSDEERRPEASFREVGVEAMTVSLGSKIAAIQLAKENHNRVLDRLNDVRREVARETGIVLPGIHLRDDIHLDPLAYVLHVRDNLVGRGTLRVDQWLAMGNTKVLASLAGEDTREPVYSLPAKWIAEADVETARAAGALVFDSLSVLASHVGQSARDNLYRVFGYQECYALMGYFRTKVPALFEQVDKRYSIVTIRQTYCYLLREFIWPRDPVAIFEALVEAPRGCEDPEELAECLRGFLVAPLLQRKKFRSMQAATPTLEMHNQLARIWVQQAEPLPDLLSAHLRKELEKFSAAMPPHQAFVLCRGELRRHLAKFCRDAKLKTTVYA